MRHPNKSATLTYPPFVIDSHCHLTFPDFHPPRFPTGVAGVLDLARHHGVTSCITVSTTTSDCLNALAIAKAHKDVWCTAGVHPLHADEGPHLWPNLKIVASDPRCVAWGELGLDNHYDNPPAEIQHQVLEEQLAFIQSCAKEGLAKPIVLHCREAFDDLLPILRKTTFDPTRFVFHCFTGSPADMRKILDFGAHVSFTGVLTYRNAAEVQEAARLVPLDRLMVETDAPYLSPDPHRGTRPCQPWMVTLTAQKLADLRGISYEALHEHLNQNTKRFFNINPT